MRIAVVSTVLGLSALAAATPTNNLFARHDQCTYSSIEGAAQQEGTCKMGNGETGMEAGYCEIKGENQVYACNYAWRNTARMSACGDAKRSKYACRKDGDPCWAFQYKEDPSLKVYRCTNIE
ncbi:hypothetical protein PG999_007525 [Apiospora kogelbergensis]|uniref:Uncharacterized protein n=1 Tax=Apiospora kogelbergensis TaxID=1337665 RepID=A0AAW0QQL0_9PEZI